MVVNMEMKDMSREQIFELRWQNLCRIILGAKEHSLRQDIEIQHIIDLLASLEQQLPITEIPQDVSVEDE